MTTRWYVPAYRSADGRVIPVGDPTLSLPWAEERVGIMRQKFSGETFVAFQDQPDWHQL